MKVADNPINTKTTVNPNTKNRDVIKAASLSLAPASSGMAPSNMIR